MPIIVKHLLRPNQELSLPFEVSHRFENQLSNLFFWVWDDKGVFLRMTLEQASYAMANLLNNGAGWEQTSGNFGWEEYLDKVQDILGVER